MNKNRTYWDDIIVALVYHVLDSIERARFWFGHNIEVAYIWKSASMKCSPYRFNGCIYRIVVPHLRQ
jgi:hypothetical protein